MASLRIPRIDPKNLSGLSDKVIGLVVETGGYLFDNESLQKKGQLQQKAGEEKLAAVQAQVKADSKEAKAKGAGQAQKSAQATKERSA